MEDDTERSEAWKLFNIFGQNMSIENLNSMPSEVKQFFFLKIFVLFECKKV